jgi:transcription initiation factor TFIIB
MLNLDAPKRLIHKIQIPHKTRKQKKINRPRTNVSKKQKMWKSFDTEIAEEHRKNNKEEDDIILINETMDNKCIQCGVLLKIMDGEGFICPNSKCGTLSNIISMAPEWRYYGADDNNASDPTRCGMPINPLLQQSSFGCLVLSNYKMTYEMRKIKKYTNYQSMPYHEQTQNKDFQYIECMARLAGLPKILINSAIQYHKQISDHPTSFRGMNRDGILGASIYIACLVLGVPRTPNEISEIFHLDQTSVTRGAKNAINILNDLEKDYDNADKTVFAKTESLSFIHRFCSRLGMNNELTKVSHFIANKIESTNYMPENIPYSIAASIIYFVSSKCNQSISKSSIARVANISEVTINKCFKKLEQHQPCLIPTVIVQKYGE